LSNINAYLIVEFFEDEYHNFVQNMDIVHYVPEKPKIKSRLITEFSGLKDKNANLPQILQNPQFRFQLTL